MEVKYSGSVEEAISDLDSYVLALESIEHKLKVVKDQKVVTWLQ